MEAVRAELEETTRNYHLTMAISMEWYNDEHDLRCRGFHAAAKRSRQVSEAWEDALLGYIHLGMTLQRLEATLSEAVDSAAAVAASPRTRAAFAVILNEARAT
eukprot:12327931-Alexandrium_andersonii.AAC.1